MKIELPYKKIPSNSFKRRAITALIGPSGCGKSRTCTDIGSTRPCLYIEGQHHLGMHHVIGKLQDYSKNIDELQYRSTIYLYTFLIARIFLQENLVSIFSDKYRKMMSFQRSVSFQEAVVDLFGLLVKNCEYSELREDGYLRIKKYAVIVDEAGDFIKLFEHRYKNTEGEAVRPFFRFLIDFLHNTCNVPLFISGTQLRLANLEMASSAAGRRDNKAVYVFTDFQHYTFEEIQNLIELTIENANAEVLIDSSSEAFSKACYFLQGRPRFVSEFLAEVLDSNKKKTFDESLDNYLEMLLNNESAEKRSLIYFWNKVFLHEKKVENIRTGETDGTPDVYMFELLRRFLFQEPNSKFCSIMMDSSDADLVSTALVSLKKVNGDSKVTYYLMEPAVMEAALNFMKKYTQVELKFMKFFLQDILDPPANYNLSPDEKGKMFDKFVALKFRLHWWKAIPDDDEAWKELPESFSDKIKKMEPPRYIYLERSAGERMLQTTFCDTKSLTYVLPAEKSGLDGCYRFVGYLGKTNFTKKIQQGDLFVDSTPRKENLVYTDINRWFGSLKEPQIFRSPILEKNKNTSFLFLCGEFPFYGPLDEQRPVKSTVGSNHIVHLDMNSRLGCYFLGRTAVEKFAALLPQRQKYKIPKIQW